MSTTTTQARKNREILDYGADNIEALLGTDPVGADLHHYLYNEGFFIIGTHQAKEFLGDYGVFEAMEKIKEYEQDNFGEITTDISDPEKVVNMLAYIVGEEILSECPTLREKWDDTLRDTDLRAIQAEMRAQLV